MRGYVERPQNISVSFIDELGEFGTWICTDFPQQFYSMNSITLMAFFYVDRMKDLRSLSFEDEDETFKRKLDYLRNKL